MRINWGWKHFLRCFVWHFTVCASDVSAAQGVRGRLPQGALRQADAAAAAAEEDACEQLQGPGAGAPLQQRAAATGRRQEDAERREEEAAPPAVPQASTQGVRLRAGQVLTLEISQSYIWTQ